LALQPKGLNWETNDRRENTDIRRRRRVKYHPPYWLDETAERLQDGDRQELNGTGDVAPLRHLVNVAATSTPNKRTTDLLTICPQN